MRLFSDYCVRAMQFLNRKLLIIPLFSIAFFSTVDYLIMVPLNVEIAKSTGFPIVRSGLLIAVCPTAAAISAFILAPFSDRLGRRRMLLILGFGFGIATLGCAWSWNVASILFFRILTGVFSGSIVSNCLAFAGDALSGARRARAITTIMLSFALASIAGVPLGSWLSEAMSWRWAFRVIAAGTFFSWSLIFFLPNIRTGAEGGRVFLQYQEFLYLFRRPVVRAVFMMEFFMLVGLFGFMSNWSLWLTSNHGFSLTDMGICYMQGGVGSLAGNRLAGFFLGRGYKISLISWGSMLTAAFLLISTLELIPAGYAGAMFFGIMMGGSIRMPGFQMLMTELTEMKMRGRLMSMSLIIANLSIGFGGFWSTWIVGFENGKLTGMSSIGVIGCLTLLMVPILAERVRIGLNSDKKEERRLKAKG